MNDDLCGLCHLRARRLGSDVCGECSRVMRGSRVTAAEADALSITPPTGGSVTASATSRTITGTGVVYNVLGRTSRGPLRVARPEDLRYPADLSEVILTREHDRGAPRGVLASLDHEDGRTRVTFRVSNDEEGTRALDEATPVEQGGSGTRRGLSFDVINPVIRGDRLVSGDVIAFGQVAIAAYGSNTRVESVAANLTTTEGTTMHLTPEMMARLVALAAKAEDGSLTEEEQSEYDALKALAAIYETEGTPEAVDEAAAVAASSHAPGVTASAAPAAVPGGIPAPSTRPPARTRNRAPGGFREGDFDHFLDVVTDALRGGGGVQSVTAALADITYGAHNNVIAPAAWSNELWSGVAYEPLWLDLFSSGTMEDLKGEGWRFTTKMVMQDYAGNKTAIPTATPETEKSPWVGARMAVGGDIDRAFFDFDTPANRAFLAGIARQAAESWPMKLDEKVRAYALAAAVPAEGVVGAAPSLIEAAAKAVRALRRRRVIGRTASAWVMVNDDDLMSLLDYNALSVPEFTSLWGIDPNNFRSDVDVPAGTVLAGAKQAAEVKTLPGSPIRVNAQHIANGGVDEAFFGYWAIEEHHPFGIASTTYTAPA
jgi:hypothetical protein